MKLHVLAIAALSLLISANALAQTCTANLGTPDWIDLVKNCGAPVNTSTDSGPYIKAAFQALDPVKGGTVYCPTGRYTIKSSVTVVSGSSAAIPGMRLLGDAGPSTDTSSLTQAHGCALIVSGLTGQTTGVLSFEGINTVTHGPTNNGPVIEYINLADSGGSAAGNTLLRIGNFNDWTVRNVSVFNAAVGLLVDGVASGDASWGYVPQFVCMKTSTCLDSERGGFVAVGGRYQPIGSPGIIAKYPQARLIGIKMDCDGTDNNIGIDFSGHGDQVEASSFEGGCSAYVNIHNSGNGIINNDGGGNIVSGNRFYCLSFATCQAVQVGTGNTLKIAAANVIIGNHVQVPNSGTAMTIGSDAEGTVIAGNSYVLGTSAISVNDSGTATSRYEGGLPGLSGQAAPTGSCSTGTLYSNTSGSPFTLYLCISGGWQPVK
jgi:hypothetical protein